MKTLLRDFVSRTTLLERAVVRWRTARLRRTHPHGLVPPAPRRVIVEPTNACNLGCAYCGNKAMLRPRTFLPMESYRLLLDQMVALGVPRITLHTVGEPTLHPRIAEMVALASERRLCSTISTNGTLLGREPLARALVEAGPDVLNVSVDAADDATLAVTRDGLKASVVIDALRLVRRLRDEVGPERDSPWGRVRVPTLTATCVLTPHFTSAVERQFIATFAPLVDDFLFHVPNNHAGFVPDEPLYRPGLLPKRLRDPLYRALRHPCDYPWDALFLLSDGSMSVCRFDFDARVTVGRFPEQSLAELWRSQAMASLRKAHMDFDFRDWPQCGDCTATWYENRAEHYAVTRRILRRNGVVPARSGWLTERPYEQGAQR